MAKYEKIHMKKKKKTWLKITMGTDNEKEWRHMAMHIPL